MRGDTREPQEILSQEDVQSPGDTVVFLLSVVAPAGKTCREEGPRRTACPVVRDTFEENERVYGCPRMQAALRSKGVEVKDWKLRRIMRENGLYPVTLRKWRLYRKGKCDAMYSGNLVQRQFNPDSLNSVWAGDITYVKTALGWMYLAVVLDLCNKEAVGYAVSKNIDTELVKRALSNAVMQRGHHDGLIFHSNRGVQYSSMGYRTMLSENGITPSMSAPGCPYDKKKMELAEV